MSEIVEWKQANLEDYFIKYIDTMDKAIELGKQLKDVGERCEIAIGKLANHVEKGKWNGGIKAFAKGIGLPYATVAEWSLATRTIELSERSDILGTSKVAIIEHAPEELKETVWEWHDSQESPPSAREISKKIREVKIEAIYQEKNIQPRQDIIHDSIENILDYVEPDSVDLILTDPPYPSEFLPLWGVLAEKAEKILRPGGFLIAYSGNYHLPKPFEYLSKHLEYIWTLALLHTVTQAIHPRRVHSAWKAILVYAKPPYEPQDEWMNDVIKGNGREKDLHEWQQGLSEFKELVTRFSRKGDLIVDPFLGSGTTVLAAKMTGRNFFGMDIDELAIKSTLGRLAE